jgi:two-component system CheB/CheR fusion protein
MVFGFIKQSGGHISAQSETGSGTVIRLFLPRTAVQCIAPASEVVAAVPGGEGQIVLIVEDNARLRQVTSRQVRDAGYHVLEADSGAAAMAILESDGGIDLLLTDIVMPGALDGLALAQAGRRLRPTMKILLTSGYADLHSGSDSTVAADFPEFPLLQKPYRRAALMRAVRDALDRA